MSVKLPFYIERIRELITWGAEKMRSFGIEADWGLLLKEIDPNVIAMWAGQSLLSVINLLTYGLVVFFITLFTLLESGHFKSKVIRAFGESNIFSDSSKQVAAEIQRYLLFKTLISFSTGFFVWAFLKIVGVDFPIIWGLLTFLLNFIPSIGSIVATIPPVLISLVQFENPLRQSLIVLLGLMAIQVTIGNYLDPKIMGRSLNLSALVIFMSLIFWGWMWGPVGMLLAVPLMVILKVALSHNPKTRPMAIMLEG
jgi:predicted PurR-regulated permease PerM